ncbi:ferritin-like domain-containing protein [Bacillus sp. DTU_2020_1000418_1_SI_GHA_SEK_038]|uniref:ferritin-like domain-containing protein n=1 Tax=Bacillus sp. DTU_2020_1000418_1_SI_GHA_SEK_038 TaxID=3077585 RepID=UPI0028E308FE|nr:ferritin-like domain-containing protein [Bacillus sp. DTU_2020_1000418_1_SI_GHA_SEK_038]WNS76502.1 ferritin-like domain-containing protein [Bacillus sp. DTU_2020_1000418_1_SI_GHA_SEK_038]
MEVNNVIDTLNKFLKGQYMGIHAYEHHIQKLKDPYIKSEFQRIQQDHKNHALKVAERIQNLGGTPVDDEGVIGSIQGFISQFKIPDTSSGIIESALTGEDYYGIQISEEIVKGDLDLESRQLIEEVLDKDRQHVDFLNRLLQ